MRDQFFKSGLVKLPEYLEEREVEKIHSAIDFIIKKPEDFSILYELDGKTPRSIANPHVIIDSFDFIIRHPKILNQVKNILGEDVYVFQLGINLKNAFNGGIWSWHRDFPTYHGEDNIPLPNMINVLIYLDDFTRDNGSFQYVLGSHQLKFDNMDFSFNNTPHPLRYASKEDIDYWINKNGITYGDGYKGEITMMHTNLLHSSHANLNNAPRRLITLTYNAISNKSVKRSSRESIVLDDVNASPLTVLDL